MTNMSCMHTNCPTVDHEERIALFTRAADTDAELPYGPLLRCVFA